jgi:hypothetical protein
MRVDRSAQHAGPLLREDVRPIVDPVTGAGAKPAENLLSANGILLCQWWREVQCGPW